MNDGLKDTINKDLILRERLAIERTSMGNDRTLLAFIRTSLYFTVAGLSIKSLLNLNYGWLIEITFLLIAGFTLFIGIVKYRKQVKSLKDSETHIGHYRINPEGNHL